MTERENDKERTSRSERHKESEEEGGRDRADRPEFTVNHTTVVNRSAQSPETNLLKIVTIKYRSVGSS